MPRSSSARAPTCSARSGSRRLLLLLLLLTVSGVAQAQTPGTPLVLLVGPGDYPGETYTQGPVAPAEYVFFEGEAVRVDVRVANWGSGADTVRLPATADRLVSASLTRLTPPPPARAPATTPVQPSAAMPVDVRLDPRPWRETAGEPARIEWTADLPLGPADALRWRVVLPATAVGPGVYRLDVELAVTDATGRRPRTQRAGLLFEVRARNAAEPAELARRAAEWLTADATPDAGPRVAAEAYAATETLARVYPDSVVVHLIRSRLADAAGDAAGARRELDAALVFMRADRDVLFRRYARPGQIEDLIDSLLP